MRLGERVSRSCSLVPGLLAFAPQGGPQVVPTVGDPAPAVAHAQWLRERPVPAPVTVVQVVDASRFGREDLTLLQRRFGERVRAVCLVHEEPFGAYAARAKRVLRRLGRWMDYAVGIDDAWHWCAEIPGGDSGRYLVIAGGRLVWAGRMHETDEELEQVVAAVLAGEHDVELEKRSFELRKRLARRSTKTDKEEMQAMIDRLLRLRPGHAAPWVAQFVLLMMTVPGRPRDEQACVDRALAALRGRPVQLAAFVNRGLFEFGETTPYLARAADALVAAQRRHRNVRALQWALFRALCAARRFDEAGESAKRLVEVSKGIPSELVRVAEELVDDRHGDRFVRHARAAVDFARLVNEENAGLERLAFAIAVRAGDRAGAVAAARRLVAKSREDPVTLSDFAKRLVSAEAYRRAFAALALEVAETALERRGGADPEGTRFVLAQACHLNGDTERAVALLREAISIAGRSKRCEGLLLKYQGPRDQ